VVKSEEKRDQVEDTGVDGTMEARGAHRVLVVKPEGKSSRGRHRCRWNYGGERCTQGFGGKI